MMDKNALAAPNAPAVPTPTPMGQQKKKKCPPFNHMVLHKPEKCWELKANASKSLEGWTSRKSTRRCVEDKSIKVW